MKTKTDISYGVIPLRKQEEEIEVLVIHQFSHIKNHAYWTFPKGHPEGGETPKETATRELQEETGLMIKDFLSDRVFENKYSFKWKGVLINKTAAFFLATIQPGDVLLQEAEVKDTKWIPVDEVLDQLDYDASKVMFKEVLHQLASLNLD